MSASARILGVANILVGAVMAAGGFLEAVALARRGQPVTLIMGIALLGGGAGVLFLASGAALWTQRRSARRVTLGAAMLALVAHGAAFGLASPGLTLLLVGVVYPVAVMLLLWSSPSLGSGQQAAASAASLVGDAPPRGSRLRVAMA